MYGVVVSIYHVMVSIYGMKTQSLIILISFLVKSIYDVIIAIYSEISLYYER